MPRVPGSGLCVDALGVAGAPAPGRRTTTVRLDGGILLDTGAAAHVLDSAARKACSHVLLSHSHLDHTLGLPFLLGGPRRTVWGPPETLAAVRESLFDGRIWPDASPYADWREILAGDTFALGPWSVEVGPAHHSVPCVSFLFRAGRRSILIAGDTSPGEELLSWAGDREPTAVVVEASFPNAEIAIAHEWGHQVPADLVAWRAVVGARCALHVTHMKPDHEAAVRAECEALDDPNLHVLQDGDALLV